MDNKQINIFAEVLENEALEQFYRAMALPQNVAGALMPDAHAGYTLPIGGVIKSESWVFPSYVGYDIGCGMAAVKLDLKKDSIESMEIREKIKMKILDFVPVGRNVHQKKKEWRLHKEGTEVLKKAFEESGAYQLGTLGGGNHFLEIGYGKDDYVWIIVHSGSRGLGKKVAEEYMRLAAIVNTDQKRYEEEFERNNPWREHNPEAWEKAKKEFVYRRVRARLKTDLNGHYGFDIRSSEGQRYLNDMNIALQFALDNRKAMIAQAVRAMEQIVGRSIGDLAFINRNHNHAEIVENNFVIHRKGATHADDGMDGVIPGNMRDGSFIVKGKGYAPALNSSSHGAGRVLSRRKAKEAIDFDSFKMEMEENGICTNLCESTVDEAPQAYKNIFEVMELQKEMVEVVDHVKPLINVKG